MHKRLMMNLLLCCLLFAVSNLVSSGQGKSAPGNFVNYLPEAFARKRLTVSVMPIFPDELLSAGFGGIIVTKVEFAADGTLLIFKVRPDTNPLVKQSLLKALPLWRFGLEARLNHTEYKTVLSRLTFMFFIKDGVGKVELYDPPPNVSAKERLDSLDSQTEFNDWIQWEQLFPQIQPGNLSS